ncbi:hypothetical protein DOO78_10145 [Roseicella frigidaeris]|uniref:Uncharacterized protein n=1 Tax=Roseicella frigidaeris TaxID=2230885 RepID=A0A327MB52_9PROT|nr:hypothetical protein DOO78_10145 [Roseicella frigidaeris]
MEYAPMVALAGVIVLLLVVAVCIALVVGVDGREEVVLADGTRVRAARRRATQDGFILGGGDGGGGGGMRRRWGWRRLRVGPTPPASRETGSKERRRRTGSGIRAP